VQDALGLIDAYRLVEHDPRLAMIAARASTPGPAQASSWALLQAVIAPYRAYHEEFPFLTPNPGILPTTGIPLAQVHATGQWLLLGPDVLPSHVLIPGPTGSGKTTLELELGLSAYAAGLRLIIVDPKGDATRLAQTLGIRSLDGTTRVNLLARTPGLSLHEHIASFTQVTTTTQFLGEHGRQVINEATHNAFQATTSPTIASLRDCVRRLGTPRDTYSRRDAINGVSLRLQRLIETYPTPSTTSDAPSMAELLQDSLYVGSLTHDDTTDWLVLLVLQTLYLAKRAAQNRTLTHVVLIDEGLLTVHKSPQTISGQSILSRLYGVVREFGISLIVTTLSLAQTDPLLRSNTGTLVVLRPHEDNDLRAATDALHLNPAQQDFVRTMPRGTCVVRHPDIPDPILCTYPPLPLDKTINHSPTTTPTSPPTSATAHLLPAPAPSTSLNTPDTTEEQWAKEPTEQPRVMALNKHEGALLAVVCDAVTPCTPAYAKAGLSLADGDGAAKLLEQKGLILRERIVLHAGRGGHGMGLAATTTGYARAGKERPVKTRGGDSVQHQFLVQELHRFLPGSTVEGMVGTKSVDLLVALNTARDADRRLITYLSAKTTMSLNAGDLVALEVETSDPAKTAPNNILKNHEAGIALTVVLVLPKEEASLKKALAANTSLPSTFVVLNVLELLTALGG
jgi:hypothetical protein